MGLTRSNVRAKGRRRQDARPGLAKMYRGQPGPGGLPLALRLSEVLDPAAQLEVHVNFIVERAAYKHSAGFLAKGLEAYGFVEAKGGSVRGVDAEVDLQNAGDAARQCKNLKQESAADTFASGLRRNIHSPDHRLVRELDPALAAEGDEANEFIPFECSEYSAIRVFDKARLNGYTRKVFLFFVARSEGRWFVL